MKGQHVKQNSTYSHVQDALTICYSSSKAYYLVSVSPYTLCLDIKHTVDVYKISLISAYILSPLLQLHFSSTEARYEKVFSEMSDSFYNNASSLLHFFLFLELI